MSTRARQVDPGEGWVSLDGASFQMGSDDFYPDEAPRHTRVVEAFDIATTPVTNAQFAVFVEETGYVTVAERALEAAEYPQLGPAERAAGSLVFAPTAGPVDLRDWRRWWSWVPGACWRHPRGPGDGIDGKGDHPVVQVAYADASAYAAWAGARLPTEVEAEYAAGGGAEPRPYSWGDERDPGGEIMANTWRGAFPYRNDGARGWRGTSPVGSFPSNGFGLYDCIGNVWEWTSGVYAAHRAGPDPASPVAAGCGCGPAEPQPGSGAERMRVLKGGSHLCAPEYCLRYRPAARSPQAEDSATTHIGFRLARDRRPMRE